MSYNDDVITRSDGRNDEARLRSKLASAESRAERAEAERDTLIAMWPTISQEGVESGGSILYGPYPEGYYQHTIGGNWPSPNPGYRSTREAAVRAAAGLTKGVE